MPKTKVYKAKSLSGAQARVRALENRIDEDIRIYDICYRERTMLAKLAADGPCFFNPLHAMEAETIRDRILRAAGLLPNGTPLRTKHGK